MAHSKWAAWQQVVLDQVDDVVEHIVEYFEPTKQEEIEVPIKPEEAVDLHPITEEESAPVVVKPKKGAKG